MQLKRCYRTTLDFPAHSRHILRHVANCQRKFDFEASSRSGKEKGSRVENLARGDLERA